MKSSWSSTIWLTIGGSQWWWCPALSRLEYSLSSNIIYLFIIFQPNIGRKQLTLSVAAFYMIHWEDFNEQSEHVFQNRKSVNLMQAGLYLVTEDNSFYSHRWLVCSLLTVTNTNLCKVIPTSENNKIKRKIKCWLLLIIKTGPCTRHDTVTLSHILVSIIYKKTTKQVLSWY